MLRSADAFHQSVIAAHQAGCSVRQIAERVGMSHQRIHQIVSNT
jgi:DNA-binding IclR family transcriptional regulator